MNQPSLRCVCVCVGGGYLRLPASPSLDRPRTRCPSIFGMAEEAESGIFYLTDSCSPIWQECGGLMGHPSPKLWRIFKGLYCCKVKCLSFLFVWMPQKTGFLVCLFVDSGQGYSIRVVVSCWKLLPFFCLWRIRSCMIMNCPPHAPASSVRIGNLPTGKKSVTVFQRELGYDPYGLIFPVMVHLAHGLSGSAVCVYLCVWGGGYWVRWNPAAPGTSKRFWWIKNKSSLKFFERLV